MSLSGGRPRPQVSVVLNEHTFQPRTPNKNLSRTPSEKLGGIYRGFVWGGISNSTERNSSIAPQRPVFSHHKDRWFLINSGDRRGFFCRTCLGPFQYHGSYFTIRHHGSRTERHSLVSSLSLDFQWPLSSPARRDRDAGTPGRRDAGTPGRRHAGTPARRYAALPR